MKFLLITVLPMLLLFGVVCLIKWSQVNLLPEDFRMPKPPRKYRYKFPKMRRKPQGGWEEIESESDSESDSSDSSETENMYQGLYSDDSSSE